MEDCELTDRELKITVIKKLYQLQKTNKQKHTPERQFSEFRNKINEPKAYFTKEIKTIEKNQTEILKLKNSIHEINVVLLEFIENRMYGRENKQSQRQK